MSVIKLLWTNKPSIFFISLWYWLNCLWHAKIYGSLLRYAVEIFSTTSGMLQIYSSQKVTNKMILKREYWGKWKIPKAGVNKHSLFVIHLEQYYSLGNQLIAFKFTIGDETEKFPRSGCQTAI
jgi:hypothetical protein